MPTKQYHTIQKQTLEITFPGVGDVLQWEKNHQQDFLHTIQTTLDRCFEAYEERDQHIILDKLELDLGTLTEANLQTEMPERLFAALQKELKDNMQNSNFENRDVHSTYSENNPGINQRSFPGTHGRLNAFLFFLQNGYLPWWGATLAGWDEEWLKKLNANEWGKTKEFFAANNSISVARLTQQFDDAFLDNLIHGFNNEARPLELWKWLLQLIDHWEEKYVAAIEKTGGQKASNLPDDLGKSKQFSIPLIRQIYWSKWIKYSLGFGDIPMLTDLFGDNYRLLDFIKISIEDKASHPETLPAKLIPISWIDELKSFNLNTSDYSQTIDLKNIEIISSNKQTDNKGDIKTEKIKSKSIENDDTLYITDAGLVLLHPFLPQLFRTCGFADEKNFLDPVSQTMAIYTIHYLVTGDIVAPEYQLLLAKLFCGLDWEVPLQPVDALPQSIRDAGDELLTEVIRHWAALKNTSPGGLRQAFLQRNGKLEKQQGGWQMLVEEKAQDVLLGRLPWGISVIKYPWMQQMLSVTWK